MRRQTTLIGTMYGHIHALTNPVICETLHFTCLPMLVPLPTTFIPPFCHLWIITQMPHIKLWNPEMLFPAQHNVSHPHKQWPSTVCKVLSHWLAVLCVTPGHGAESALGQLWEALCLSSSHWNSPTCPCASVLLCMCGDGPFFVWSNNTYF